MASSSRGTGSEDNDNDSDFDNQSHEDEDEQIINTRKQNEDLLREQEEQQKQIFLRQQKIVWGIEQEWLRKEQNYIEQLEKMDQHVFYL